MAAGSQYKIYGQNRFRFSPVSKLWCGCTLFGSCALIPLRKFKWQFVLAYPNLIEGKQLWKILTSKIFFLDFQGIVSGCLLIYYLRLLERRLGSRNFSNFLVTSLLVSTALEIAGFGLLKEFHVFETPFFASGPYCVLFSCLVQFALDIPSIPYGYVYNIPVSGKILPYLLSFQMLLISPCVTLSCLCGVVAGLLHRVEALGLNKVNLIPEMLGNFLGKVLKPIIDLGEDRKGI